MAAHIVIEIQINVEAVTQPFPDVLHVAIEVPPLVVACQGSIVTAYVYKISGDRFAQGQIAPVCKTQSHAMVLQEIEDFRVEPRRVSHFDNRPDFSSRRTSLQNIE